jgi:hypothetical protein
MGVIEGIDNQGHRDIVISSCPAPDIPEFGRKYRSPRLEMTKVYWNSRARPNTSEEPDQIPFNFYVVK